MACMWPGCWAWGRPHGPALGECGGLTAETGWGQGLQGPEGQMEDGQTLRGANHRGKPRGGQVSGEGPPALNGLTKKRLWVYQQQDASDRHQLNNQEPLKPKIPGGVQKSQSAAGPESIRSVLRASHPASVRSLGCLEHLAFWRGLGEEKYKGRSWASPKELSVLRWIKAQDRDFIIVFSQTSQWDQIKSNAEHKKTCISSAYMGCSLRTSVVPLRLWLFSQQLKIL